MLSKKKRKRDRVVVDTTGLVGVESEVLHSDKKRKGKGFNVIPQVEPLVDVRAIATQDELSTRKTSDAKKAVNQKVAAAKTTMHVPETKPTLAGMTKPSKKRKDEDTASVRSADPIRGTCCSAYLAHKLSDNVYLAAQLESTQVTTSHPDSGRFYHFMRFLLMTHG